MTADRQTWQRAIPLAAAGSAFAGFAALWLLGLHGVYQTLLFQLGVPVFRFPFLDTQAILAAVECRRAGIDVYRVDPCDYLGRLHVYSPLWLRADVLPVSTDWTPLVGLAFVTTFLLSLLLLPPVRGRGAAVLMVLAAMSPRVLFAMERGNNDLLVFAMAAATATLCLGKSRASTAGSYLLVLLSTALKYYPLALLVLALRERPLRCAIIMTASVVVLGTPLLLDLHEVVHALSLIPSNFFASGFGMRSLPFGLAASFHWSGGAAVMLLMVLVFTMASVARICADWLQPALARLPDRDVAFLLTGAALIVACFVSAQNIAYREIHLLFLLPGLLRLSRDRTKGARLAAYTVVTMIFVLWAKPFGPFVWLLKELAWWWIVTMASAFLWNAIRRSEITAHMLPPLRLQRQSTLLHTRP